jgi:hypothetical protein
VLWGIAALDRRQRFGLRLGRVELREDRFQRVEPRRIRVGIIFERVPAMGYERASLISVRSRFMA